MSSLSSPPLQGGIRDHSRQAEAAAQKSGQQHDSLKAAAWTSVALISVGMATYAPAAALEYGRSDDYWLVYSNATYRPDSVAWGWFEGGRFISGLAARWLFPYVDSVPELFHMRLVAIIALSLTGAALSVMTLRLLAPPRSPVHIVLAQLTGLVALVTPAAPSAATWGLMAVQLWALPLALASGMVATAHRRVFGIRWEPLAGVFIFLSTFTYQPMAAISLLPIFMWSALRWARREPPQWRRPMVVTALLVASLACNVMVVKSFHLTKGARLGGHGVSEALLWFAGEYLPRTVAFGVPTSLASLALTLVVLAAALLSPVTIGARYLALPIAVLCAWFMASSIVVPGELWASYRLVMTPQTILWCGSAACVAFTICEWHRGKPEPATLLVAVLAAGALALVGTSSYRAYVYLAKPNAVDWASVECVVRDSPPLTNQSVLVVNPFVASRSPVRAYDEYGIAGSSIDWALPDMVWLAAENVDADHLPPTANAMRLRVVRQSSEGSTAPGALQFRQDICGALPLTRG